MADTSRTNPWFGISMALIGVMVGYGVALGTSGGRALPANIAAPAAVAPTPSAPAAPATADNVRKVDATDHVRGKADATISIISYEDFQCPFCQRVHGTLMQALEKNKDDVNIVFRHFPLSFHESAQPTAEASECVAELGGNDAFWKFVDVVFEKGADKTKLSGYATEAGVDAKKFDECMTSGKYTAQVNAQMTEGTNAGVSGTPGNIVINNKTGKTQVVSGAQPIESFQSAIDALK